MTNDRLTSDGNMNFEELMDIIRQLLMGAWGREWGDFFESYPNGNEKDDIDFPYIVYDVERIKPAEIGGNVELKPRTRGRFTDNVNGEKVAYTIKSQTLDYHVNFDVWHETNEGVNTMAKRFREFITTYSGYLMKQGMQQIFFVEQTKGSETQKLRDNAQVRSVRYVVRIEEQTVVPSHLIETVTGKVQVKQEPIDDYIVNSEIRFKEPKEEN